jgi:hypothetical protein
LQRGGVISRSQNRQCIHLRAISEAEQPLTYYWQIKKARIIEGEVRIYGAADPYEPNVIQASRASQATARRNASERRPKVSTRRPEARRIFAAMVDRDEIGIRLLIELRSNASQSTMNLAHAVDASVDVVAPALIRLKEVGLVRLRGDAYSCTQKAKEFLHQMENMSDVSISSPSYDPGRGAHLREAVQDTLLIKGEAVMKGAPALAPTSSSTEDEFIGNEENQIILDPNYRAYLAEIDDLEKEGKYSFVAYANGRQIAKARNFDDLLAQIGDREEEVLIQEIPPKVVQFRERFRVEA